jgi:hypothetical protein
MARRREWRRRRKDDDDDDDEEEETVMMASALVVVMKFENGHLFIAVTFSTDLKTSSCHCLDACWQDHFVSRRFFVPRRSFLVCNKTRLSFISLF